MLLPMGADDIPNSGISLDGQIYIDRGIVRRSTEGREMCPRTGFISATVPGREAGRYAEDLPHPIDGEPLRRRENGIGFYDHTYAVVNCRRRSGGDVRRAVKF